MVLARPPGLMRLPEGAGGTVLGGGGRAMSQSVNVTTSSRDDQTQILSERGELDLATADGLYRRGRAAIGRRARLLLLDLAGMSFSAAWELCAFVRLANEAETSGCCYVL